MTIDLDAPAGREAGFRRPAIVVTAQRVLDAAPSVVHVVPLTSTRRGFRSEVELEPDAANRLAAPSSAQCQHVRSVSTTRLAGVTGNVGAVALSQIRETIALLLDLNS